MGSVFKKRLRGVDGFRMDWQRTAVRRKERAMGKKKRLGKSDCRLMFWCSKMGSRRGEGMSGGIKNNVK
ncbi:hypothetical protein, partial [Bacillus altitudinis]|uniref:hypothetical protein n=1 Tax=Bacillus altitudinis TaxID=293387 RepID=UPI001C930D7E